MEHKINNNNNNNKTKYIKTKTKHNNNNYCFHRSGCHRYDGGTNGFVTATMRLAICCFANQITEAYNSIILQLYNLIIV